MGQAHEPGPHGPGPAPGPEQVKRKVQTKTCFWMPEATEAKVFKTCH